MAINDLRPIQDTQEAMAAKAAIRQLWQLYGEMRRMTAYAAQVAEIGADGKPQNLVSAAQVFGYQDDTEKAGRFLAYLFSAAEYMTAELPDTDGKDTNPIRALMHLFG